MLTIGEFESNLSNAGDALLIANGAQWSTPTEYNGISGVNCAQIEGSAAWLLECVHEAMPLSLLWPLTDFNHADSVEWKMRPNNCPGSASAACSGCSPGLYICSSNQGMECCTEPLSSCEQVDYSGVY